MALRAGAQASEVLVESNAGDSPHRLTIAGEYRPPLLVEVLPAKLDLAEVPVGKRRTARLALEVLTKEAQDVSVASLKSTNDQIAAAVVKEAVHNVVDLYGYRRRTFEVEVTATGDRIGQVSAQLTINWSLRRLPPTVVPIVVTCVNRWVMTPAKVMLIAARQDTTGRRQGVMIKDTRCQELKVRELVNPKPEWIEVTTEPGLAKDELHVWARIKDLRRAEDSYDGTIIVKTDGQDEIHVPLRVRIVD
jgi:hypothetical protein